jgi:hypothetical protein
MIEILNKTEAEATENLLNAGKKVRVVKRNGIKTNPFQHDFNVDRINLEIENGIVVKAYHG